MTNNNKVMFFVCCYIEYRYVPSIISSTHSSIYGRVACSTVPGMYILPLSHKSGALCLYEPLSVSDALGDDFFGIFDVFLVETFSFFF